MQGGTPKWMFIKDNAMKIDNLGVLMSRNLQVDIDMIWVCLQTVGFWQPHYCTQPWPPRGLRCLQMCMDGLVVFLTERFTKEKNICRTFEMDFSPLNCTALYRWTLVR